MDAQVLSALLGAQRPGFPSCCPLPSLLQSHWWWTALGQMESLHQPLCHWRVGPQNLGETLRLLGDSFPITLDQDLLPLPLFGLRPGVTPQECYGDPKISGGPQKPRQPQSCQRTAPIAQDPPTSLHWFLYSSLLGIANGGPQRFLGDLKINGEPPKTKGIPRLLGNNSHCQRPLPVSVFLPLPILWNGGTPRALGRSKNQGAPPFPRPPHPWRPPAPYHAWPEDWGDPRCRTPKIQGDPKIVRETSPLHPAPSPCIPMLGLVNGGTSTLWGGKNKGDAPRTAGEIPHRPPLPVSPTYMAY